MDEQHLKYVGEAPTNGAFNSGVCNTYIKECYTDIIEDKPIHHAAGALAAKLWPRLSNGCGRQNCSEKQCAESCETLDACKAWTYGNHKRCYLMDEQHLKYVGEAPTNGAFNSAVCVNVKVTSAPTKAPTKAPTRNPTKAPTKNPTPAPTNSPTSAPTYPRDEIDVDMDVPSDFDEEKVLVGTVCRGFAYKPMTIALSDLV